jgi:hypothetical protein
MLRRAWDGPGRTPAFERKFAGVDLRLSLRTVPGVKTSCVTIFNTMGGGELWLFAERFLKGQEIDRD